MELVLAKAQVMEEFTRVLRIFSLAETKRKIKIVITKEGAATDHRVNSL